MALVLVKLQRSQDSTVRFATLGSTYDNYTGATIRKNAGECNYNADVLAIYSMLSHENKSNNLINPEESFPFSPPKS